MAHSYSSLYPAGSSVELDIVEFFENFYRVSDTPGHHENYVDQFTQDATFILASKKAVGRQEILRAREAMWTAVEARKHTVPKIFPFGDKASEFMLHGIVELKLKNGAEAKVDWAGRAQVVKTPEDGKYRLAFYQVYLDTGAIAAYNK